MRYACIIYYDPETLFGGGPEANSVLAECSTYDEVLTASGHFVAGEALTMPRSHDRADAGREDVGRRWAVHGDQGDAGRLHHH